MKKRVSLFIDVQNIYYTTRHVHGCSFDYNTFWAQATANRNVIHAYAYATERGDEKQKQFQNILRAIGFQVKLKPYIQRSDGSSKGDWDVGITLDVIEAAADTDILVLGSGDGDFDQLLKRVHLRYPHVETEVYGVPGLTAHALINSATRYIPIEGSLLLNPKPKLSNDHR